VKNADPAGMRRKVESVLRRHNLEYDLRSWGQDELVYSVEVPIAKRTDAISGQLVSLGGKDPVGIEWDEKKPK
jgi:hypothetical protein